MDRSREFRIWIPWLSAQNAVRQGKTRFLTEERGVNQSASPAKRRTTAKTATRRELLGGARRVPRLYQAGGRECSPAGGGARLVRQTRGEDGRRGHKQPPPPRAREKGRRRKAKADAPRSSHLASCAPTQWSWARLR
jgi:hypothetical protein